MKIGPYCYKDKGTVVKILADNIAIRHTIKILVCFLDN